MNILVASSLFGGSGGGGAARSARLIAEGMFRRGHKVSVITSGQRKAIATHVQAGVEITEIPPHNMYWVRQKSSQSHWKRFPWQFVDMWNPMVLRSAMPTIERIGPDVAHVQKLRGLSPAIWTALKRAGIPIVHTCRDYEILSPEGTLVGNLGRMAREEHVLLRPYQALRRKLSAAVSIFTAPSAYTLDVLLGLGFFANAESAVVPNSHGFSDVELISLHRQLRPPADNPRLKLLYVGRFEGSKGVDMLCEAVYQLVVSGVPVELVLAGWGSSYEQLKDKYGSLTHFSFVGAKFGEAKRQLYADADLAVVPSVWPEVFGNVVVESYAFGRPVLVSDSGGLPELVLPGQKNLVFRSGDPKALASAIRIAAESKYVRQLFDECLLESTKYSLDTMLIAYESLYSRAIAKAKR